MLCLQRWQWLWRIWDVVNPSGLRCSDSFHHERHREAPAHITYILLIYYNSITYYVNLHGMNWNCRKSTRIWDAESCCQAQVRMVAEQGSSSQSFGAKCIPQGFLLWLPGLADSTEHSIICVGGMLSIYYSPPMWQDIVIKQNLNSTKSVSDKSDKSSYPSHTLINVDFPLRL